jgi:hypothetical protein
MRKAQETPYIHFAVEKGVLIGTYMPNVLITFKHAKEIVATRLAFTEGKKMPILILNQGIIKMDKDARDYLASAEGIAGLTCAAILINSNFISITVNFFLKVTKPKLLVQTFTDKNEALQWLQDFVAP